MLYEETLLNTIWDQHGDSNINKSLKGTWGTYKLEEIVEVTIFFHQHSNTLVFKEKIPIMCSFRPLIGSICLCR